MMNANSDAAMPAGWLVVDVSGLVGSPGLHKRFDSTGGITGFGAGLGGVARNDPVEVRLDLASTADAISANGRVAGRLTLECSRCLQEYVQDFDLSVKEYFFFDPSTADERDGYEVRNESVDLEPMLRDVIVLSIPIKPVHAPDCRGLCPVCGTNLNEADCGHDARGFDLRWAPLKDLFVGESPRRGE